MRAAARMRAPGRPVAADLCSWTAHQLAAASVHLRPADTRPMHSAISSLARRYFYTAIDSGRSN